MDIAPCIYASEIQSTKLFDTRVVHDGILPHKFEGEGNIVTNQWQKHGKVKFM